MAHKESEKLISKILQDRYTRTLGDDWAAPTSVVRTNLYKCPNWGYCDKTNQIISIAAGEPAICQECGKKLILVKRTKTSNNNLTILGSIVLILLLISTALWFFLQDNDSSRPSPNMQLPLGEKKDSSQSSSNIQLPLGENVVIQDKSLSSTTKVREVEATKYFIIVKSTKSKDDAIEYAKELGASGYPSEVILSSTNYYGVVLGRFNLEDAKKAINAALVSGVVKNKPYLMTSARVIDYVYSAAARQESNSPQKR